MLSPVLHPGPVNEKRWQTEISKAFTGRVQLAPQTPIMDALRNALDGACKAEGIDATCGFARFVGGTLDHVEFCYPTQSRPGAPMPYGETIVKELQDIVTGTAVIGLRRGEAEELTNWSHIHVTMKDAQDSLTAGHLWAETVTGNDVVVDLTLTPQLDLVNDIDPETQLPVFTPYPRHAPSAPEVSDLAETIAFTRIRPNVELHDAISSVVSYIGWGEAAIGGGTGSLVGATFVDPRNLQIMEVAGPATEVMTLRGTYAKGKPLELDATLIGSDGVVCSGRLAPRGNLVAATYELILTKVS